MQSELSPPPALPAALRLPGRMSPVLREAWDELAAEPLFALWLAGNLLGFLILAWLLATA